MLIWTIMKLTTVCMCILGTIRIQGDSENQKVSESTCYSSLLKVVALETFKRLEKT